MIKVLIAEDDKNLKKFLRNELSGGRYRVTEADKGVEVLDLLEKEEFDILVLDLKMPGLGGMEVLKKIKSLDYPSEVIVMTGYATVQTAIEALKLGAYDYITKPFTIEQLTAAMEKAYEKKRLSSENSLLKAQLKRQSEAPRIITNSPLMESVLEEVRKMAASEYPVLISGESGVGKELIAKLVHNESMRKDGPFIPINCGAIPENMLETELFGYEKGAFTGAYGKKPGLAEIANNGTLFLDEIGELPMALQGKLLRVIELGKFFRVGGVKEVSVDVRYVCATNKVLEEEIKKAQFRQDLYYRISALTVKIPPLRDRKESIPQFIYQVIHNNPSFKNKSFSPAALKILCAYQWPGNVRELLNVIHRILLLSRADIIEEDDLPQDLRPKGRITMKTLDEMEREYIMKVLDEVKGQKKIAAEILGIDKKTLYRKLLSFGYDT